MKTHDILLYNMPPYLIYKCFDFVGDGSLPTVLQHPENQAPDKASNCLYMEPK